MFLWSFGAFDGNINCNTKGYEKAGERIRTAAVQLGNINVDSVTPSYSNTYKSPENHLTANLTKNPTTIQQDLAKIIKRWPSLPPNIKTAIMMLIGGDEDE